MPIFGSCTSASAKFRRRTTLNRPNGVSTSYSYDALSRLLSVMHQAGSTTLDGAAYGYDAAGNRTSKTVQAANQTFNYTYDPIYELTRVVQGATTKESYTYDGVGNRLSSPAGAYTYNSSNQLLTSPGATWGYDANGRVISHTDSTGTTTYAWDFENRLVSVTLPGTGGTVNFKYDPFGRRIQKSSAGGTTNYAYDGDNIAEELNASGAAVARYTQGLGIDEPLAMYRSGVASYYHADGLGSIAALTNSTGFPTAAYLYDSFGNLVASAGNVVNPFRYTGREFDSETGLYYYRARYYDTMTGRFLSEDPVRFGTGAPDFYVYVENGSPNFSDPTGHLKKDDTNKCCDWQNIEAGIGELERKLNTARVLGHPVFKKYQECLKEKAFPQETVRCASKTSGCGSFDPFSADYIYITPVGALGRRSKGCGPVAATLVHELVHNCQFRDTGGVISEKEGFGVECELFGSGCACARDPKRCGYR